MRSKISKILSWPARRRPGYSAVAATVAELRSEHSSVAKRTNLDLLDFLAHDLWIVLSNLLGAVLLVVERAAVLVCIPVSRTEDTSTSARETWMRGEN